MAEILNLFKEPPFWVALFFILVVVLIFSTMYFIEGGIGDQLRAAKWCEDHGHRQHPDYRLTRCLKEESCSENVIGFETCDYNEYVRIPSK